MDKLNNYIKFNLCKYIFRHSANYLVILCSLDKEFHHIINLVLKLHRFNFNSDDIDQLQNHEPLTNDALNDIGVLIHYTKLNNLFVISKLLRSFPKYVNYVKDFAIEYGKPEILKFLVENYQNDLYFRDKYFKNIEAFDNSTLDIDTQKTIKTLSLHLFTIKEKNLIRFVNTILFNLAKFKAYYLIKLILKHNSHYIDYKYISGNAAIRNDKKLVQIILNSNLQLKANTAFKTALEFDNYEMAKYLYPMIKRINIYEYYKSLDYAVENNDLQMLNFLLRHNVDHLQLLNLIKDNQFLIMAISKGNLDIVKALINVGDNINERKSIINAQQGQALIRAVEVHNHPIIKYLVEEAVTPVERQQMLNAQDSQALITAFDLHNIKMVKYLLKHGADVTAQNNYIYNNAKKDKSYRHLLKFLEQKKY